MQTGIDATLERRTTPSKLTTFGCRNSFMISASRKKFPRLNGSPYIITNKGTIMQQKDTGNEAQRVARERKVNKIKKCKINRICEFQRHVKSNIQKPSHPICKPYFATELPSARMVFSATNFPCHKLGNWGWECCFFFFILFLLRKNSWRVFKNVERER